MSTHRLSLRGRPWRALARPLILLVVTLSFWGGRQASAAPAATTTTLYAVQDTYLLSTDPTDNYGSGPLGVTPDSVAYAQFDLSILPAGVVIDTATLRLKPADIVGVDPSDVRLARIDGAWAEGAVTWNTRPPITPGPVSTTVSDYDWVEWTITPLAQQWYSGATPNEGVAMLTEDDGVYFFSKEGGVSPELVITYHGVDDPTDPPNHPHPDLGDAPDSTNHLGIANTAYPSAGIAGNFPTVWDDPTGAPSGPLHRNESAESWLGLHLSAEREADGGPDQDGVNNILNAGADNANLDRADDGWLNRNALFINCQPTTLTVRVSKAVTATLGQMYLNVWFDGTRDGDWADMGQCPPGEPSAPPLRSFEWIVQNFVVNTAGIAPGGFQDFSVNTELVLNQAPDDGHWLRFTLSERPVAHPAALPADGRGPQHPNSFDFGETEDYPYRPDPQGEPGELHLEKKVEGAGQGVQPGDIVTFTIGLAHVGGSAPATSAISDTLPTGVRLAGPVTVQEEAPQVGPLLAHIVGDHIGWRGALSPGGKLVLTIPVRIEHCFGPDREIYNVAVARQTDGSTLQADANFTVHCRNVSLDNLIVRRFLVYPAATNSQEAPEAVLTEFPPGYPPTYLPGSRTRIRTELTNSGSEPLPLALLFDKISWSYVEDPAPSLEPTATASLTTGEAITAVVPGGERQHILLALGESKVIDTPIPPPDRVDDELEQNIQGESTLRLCLAGDDPLRCADPGSVQHHAFHFLLRHSDLGDAPDSSNHWGMPMAAYPGVPAQFPTVYWTPAAGPHGPLHWRSRPFHLGQAISGELEADIGPDQDFVNNIVPPANLPNRDRDDDGIRPDLLNFEQCQPTKIPVRVFITPAVKAWLLANSLRGHLNIWVDANRDGDWDDRYPCPDEAAGGQPKPVTEHIAVNYPLDPALLVPGINNVIVTTLPVPWPAEHVDQPAWLRVTLTVRPIDLPLQVDGLAYSDGRGAIYLLGETEDYLWRPALQPEGPDMAVRKQGAVRQEFDREAGVVRSKIAWAIEYQNRGDRPAEGVVLRDVLTGDENLADRLLEVHSTPIISYAVDGQALIFQVGEVAPGDSGRVVIVMGARQEELTTVTLTNTVTVHAATDANPDNDTAQATVQIGLRSPRIQTPIDGSTCKNDVAIAGRAAPHAAVDLYVDDALVQTVNADANGFWTATVNLADGAHELYAIARVGGASSAPSDTVTLLVDSTLAWDPISLRFIDPRGHVQQPHDENGRLDAEGWRVNLRPNTTYTVAVHICCADPNVKVGLAVEGLGTLALTDEDGDGIFTASFTTGDRDNNARSMSLTVRCEEVDVTATGSVFLVDPEGIVYDVLTGTPLDQATVACLQAPASSDAEATGGIFTLWDAAPFNQVNPQQTAADGFFSFLTPPGVYQIAVSRAGYQPYRSSTLEVISEAVHYDVPLTPLIAEGATTTVTVSAAGFDPPVLTVAPGAVVAWVNVDAAEHTSTVEQPVGAAFTSDEVRWDSGLLAVGENYKFQLHAEGVYTYVDQTDPANTATIVVSAGAPPAGQQMIFLPLVQQ